MDRGFAAIAMFDLQGCCCRAIAGCRVLLWEGGALWSAHAGATKDCRCRVPLQVATASRCCLGAAVRVVCALWSGMLVPLQGAAEGAGAGCCCCCQIGVCALELVCWGHCRVPLLEGAAVRIACALWSRHAAGCRCRQGCALWSGHAGAAPGCCCRVLSEWNLLLEGAAVRVLCQRAVCILGTWVLLQVVSECGVRYET